MDRYIGLDVSAQSCSLAVVGPSGKRLKLDVVETNAAALVRPARRGRPASVGRASSGRRSAGSGGAPARTTTTRRTKRARSTPGA